MIFLYLEFHTLTFFKQLIQFSNPSIRSKRKSECRELNIDCLEEYNQYIQNNNKG